MSAQAKRVLVLGGTAYLSRTIARTAVERGHRVTVAARGVSGEPPEGVEFVSIDRGSAEGVEALRGGEFDAVFDVARMPAHVGPVLDVLADGAGYWSFVSTISVYARNDVVSGEVHEPTATDSADPSPEVYGASKVACENLVRERLGDRALVTRPGLIVGPGDPVDRLGYWPLRFAEGGEVLAPGDRDRPVQWIDVQDYADWLLDAADAGVTGTLDAIGDHIGMGAFLDGIADALIAEGVIAERPDLTWVPQEFLLEHGVRPWAGHESLGFWVPSPDYDGHGSRPAGPAVTAGLRLSSLQETVKRWWRANAAAPSLRAGMSRVKEGEVLAAWHGTEPDPELERYDRERGFAVPAAARPAG
ncbi:NAD-dependent epimerase/dehydratase family protein [Glycomyces sp. A-F 0318]|uniref:NAD-dependent epimerase/dehydratase family protein n=1 Tax=Glycomyces amatae TaxID=2881355 RepID=UPI001E58F770|nr:NAD-dependent epimerase/dehydratase family protein [Glycomyces amatae]MCD0446121.1 NAD-dependent epimerase/dehydratase family protein [Glycomyces amatae]